MSVENTEVPKEQLLVKLALKQKSLLDYVFDFDTHTPRVLKRPKQRLFRRSKYTEYDRLLSELEEIRGLVYQNFPCELFTEWWQAPWEVLEKYLLASLEDINRDGNWRFDSKIQSFSDGLTHYVILSDEGAAQSFSGEKIYQYEKLSYLSEEEKHKRMKQYDKALLDKYLYLDALSYEQNAFIQGSLTEKVYSDVVDYFISEGWLIDSVYRNNYEDKMYYDKIIEGTYANAISRLRVKGIFLVGYFIANEHGRLQAFQSLDYQPISINPQELNYILLNRHIPGTAIVKLCEFICDSSDVKDVPLALISKAFDKGKNNLDYLCLQSALLTLLADKLV